MNFERRIQVMQAAAVIFAAQKAGSAAMSAAGKNPAIQPPTDDEAMKHCVELVLRTLQHEDLWPKKGDASFLEVNF